MKTTRKNVIAALEKIQQNLKLIKKIPENGLAVFCGNVSKEEGKQDIRVWLIEPPFKLKTKIYWCGQEFVLDPLKEMLREKDVYGLIVLDAGHATIGLIEGKSIKVVKDFDSNVPGKTSKGGWCIDPNTSVIDENLQWLKVSELKKGLKIIGFDFKTKKIVASEVMEIFERNVDEIYEIISEKSRIRASKDHLFFVFENSQFVEKAAENLKKGEILLFYNPLTQTIEESRIIEIRKIDESSTFIDLETETGNFFANNLLVHNSQQRYQRIREQALHEYLKKVGEIASKAFLDIQNLKGVIIGGPGPVKEQFYKGDYLHYKIKEKILGLKDTGYTGEYGLEELVKRSQDLLKEAKIIKEKQILQKFFEKIFKNEDVVYGFTETKKALESGAVETLLISEEFDFGEYKIECLNCGYEEIKVDYKRKLPKKCPKCGSRVEIEQVRDFVEELVEKAKTFRTNVVFISDKTPEGKEFLSLGGIGGFLRFKVFS